MEFCPWFARKANLLDLSGRRLRELFGTLSKRRNAYYIRTSMAVSTKASYTPTFQPLKEWLPILALSLSNPTHP